VVTRVDWDGLRRRDLKSLVVCVGLLRESVDWDSSRKMCDAEGGEEDQGGGAVLIRIHVPDLNIHKCLQFYRHDLVWDVKQQCLASLPKVRNPFFLSPASQLLCSFQFQNSNL